MRDTAPEINAEIFRRMMTREAGERLVMGLDMTATAKALVLASLPGQLGEEERRLVFVRRFYGPEAEGTLRRCSRVRQT